LLPYISREKYIYILALEMASAGTQHCASCIGTLAFSRCPNRAALAIKPNNNNSGTKCLMFSIRLEFRLRFYYCHFQTHRQKATRQSESYRKNIIIMFTTFRVLYLTTNLLFHLSVYPCVNTTSIFSTRRDVSI